MSSTKVRKTYVAVPALPRIGGFSKIELREVGVLVVDGIKLDARAAPNNADAQRVLRIATDSETGIATIRCNDGGRWIVHILETLGRNVPVPEETTEHFAEAQLPQYLVWPTGVTQAPQTVTETRALPMSTGEDFIVGLKPQIQRAANEFERLYNPFLAAMSTRDYIISTVHPNRENEITAEKRQRTADEWGRAWIGFAAKMVWYVENEIEDTLTGVNVTFDASRADDIVDRLTDSLYTNTIRDWFNSHDVDAYVTHHAERKLVDKDGTLIYTSPTDADWHELKTKWFSAGLWNDYPGYTP